MKQVILDVLEDVSQEQVNLESEAAREMVANLLIASIKSKGCYTEYGDDNKLDTAGKDKALDVALSQIEQAYGKGSVMKLGQRGAMDVESISTGSISLDNRVSNIGPNCGVSFIILVASFLSADLTPA